MTECIRHCTTKDLDQVADLFESVFRKRETPAPPLLREYFNEIYFRHPYHDDRLHSFVYQLGDGMIAGFLGVLPLRLRFLDEPLLGAVAGNLMVRRDLKNPFAGARLVKAFLDGPQDLAFSDTANEISRRMWEASGGVTLMLASLQWIRVLRPAQFAMHLAERKASHLPFGRLPYLACSCIDLVAERVRARKPKGPSPDWSAYEWDHEQLLVVLTQTAQNYALRPDHDANGFRWLTERAREKTQHGPLHGKIVSDRFGVKAGWYLYYGRKGGLAHVLQIGAAPRARKAVLSAMIADAYHKGCIALLGNTESRLMRDLADEECIFVLRGAHTVVHAAREDLLRALQRGDAFLSRLEGEWWTRLQGDSFG